ncbi:MAG: methylmalonyl Co-A mutase-associated GTPase MeaB [Bacteroidales bacterium]|nr:methylmalonyl Co-A mutase-associated GTPase MeaB [Bacteroidales bacterium]
MKNRSKSALKINESIAHPPNINPYINTLKTKKERISIDEYYNGIIKNNRAILAKAITLIESSLQSDQKIARKIIEKCLPYTGNSYRIGITGVPGVGKSTFIEVFGNYLISLGYKVAVLAIDPSSTITKGSILGDKTRMENLARNPSAFIRPSPSGGTLGGVARKTREAMLLCEAAGYNVILIETTGVGQSETAVHSMTDTFILLMLAGAGDELQGIKRGIIEISDFIVITKADGDNYNKCIAAAHQYKEALNYLPLPESGWKCKVHVVSAKNNMGIKELFDQVQEYFSFIKNNGYFHIQRQNQNKYWMYETINNLIKDNLLNNPKLNAKLLQFEKKVIENKITSFEAAERIFNLIKKI